MEKPNTALLELVRKYNRPGPRYTSYPTALQFSEAADFAFLENDAAVAEEPLSLYVHLPFCRSLCWFCGCTNEITTQSSRADRYLDFLEREIAHYCRSRKAALPPVVQLHFGGGTPNFLTASQLARLGELLHRAFSFEKNAECSVELDPRRLSREQVDVLAQMGMTRASIGIQDVNPQVQKAVHRVQPQTLNEQAFQWLRGSGFKYINVDLMYGLPFQTPESWEKTLETVAILAPERLAVFNYAHVPWMKPAQKNLERFPRPSPDEKLSMLLEAISYFKGHGFEYVGMDHFARPEDPLFQARKEGTLQRNFQGYSTHAGAQILAFGISGISQTPRGYRQNFKAFDAYESAVRSGKFPLQRGYVLTEQDIRRGHAISRLMCDLKLPESLVDEFAGVRAAMAPFEKDGLIYWENGMLQVSDNGRLFIRNIAMAFDAYLKNDETRFSKTV